MQTETKLTARLVKAWREMGAEVLNIHGNKFQSVGWPDVFICHNTWTGWIEFKGPKTPWQPGQQRILKSLSKAEQVWVVRFIVQQGEQWTMHVSHPSNFDSVFYKTFIGTDGQVAAKLLHTLKGLDEA